MQAKATCSFNILGPLKFLWQQYVTCYCSQKMMISFQPGMFYFILFYFIGNWLAFYTGLKQLPSHFLGFILKIEKSKMAAVRKS